MAWYDNSCFYHIYPLGMAGAPALNDYSEPVERLNKLLPWIEHIKNIGCNALYIGPLFESVGHGYETTDYKKLDSRLGTNDTLKNFVNECHKAGIKVIFDGVFNHTGRDFFAFKDIQANRENSAYKDWYCNVNFWGNNEYNDGFSYDNWGGYNLLAKLNQKNPAVKDYICDVIRFWVKEFDVDGIRLDAADVLDFDFMKDLRRVANEVKPEFWLMGEVIHGNYARWVNESTLHSVTNYAMHKALYSGHNDHNYFEIAHTVKYLSGMCGNNLKLYNFVDNHDVERINSKLTNKANYNPVHVLMYTMPGVPSIYYGSEFGIEGVKGWGTDAPLRPELNFEEYQEKAKTNPCVKLISALGKIRQETEELNCGEYKELVLTNKQFSFARNHNGSSVIITVNNDEADATMTVQAGNCAEYIGAITGVKVPVQNGCITVSLKANSGEIWRPADKYADSAPKVAVDESVVEPTAEVDAVPVVETVVEETAMPIVEPVVEAEAESTIESEAIEENVVSIEETVAPVEKAVVEGNVENDIESVKEEAKAEEEVVVETTKEELKKTVVIPANKSYEEMTVEELQQVILGKMAKNGPVTEYMEKTVYDNTHQGSLVTWAKSF
ncbi:MAG: alpha-amylase [Lachnospiraceae bacterium]|nr:alpha-amylase [Lachnospiraceae bacterium]